MKNKTLSCPHLTAEDKKFLKYELKVYKENFKMLLQFHKRHEELLAKTDIEAENYDDATYSALCFDTGSDIFYALSMTHVHFVDDICSYFATTRGIKELNSEERTLEEVINETEMLTLDGVFDKYIREQIENNN
ncbi:MAG: hypothetical protein HFE51_09940 [Clostridia bacterium]|nr:hypothetical protein [Clostridia bacterium]MCI8979378.1 hypothetical protein [Clostridia bacterium]MCI9086723.1 hypothetical protein [Clostridia bacterium]NDO20326.1 hypothetical protein [Lachnospiraceae bacterium MD329]